MRDFTAAQRRILDDWRHWAPWICRGYADGRFYPDGWATGRLAALSPDDILAAVEAESGVPEAAILGARRGRREARARQLVMVLAADLCPGRSLPAVAAFLNRDHTTVLHGLKVARRRLDRGGPAFEPDFHDLCGRVRRVLGR